jgi:hypothetical protein
MAGDQRLASHLIPASEWSPLDGTAPPPYVPPNWDGVHTGVRLIEAFQILARVVMTRGPQGYGSAWPSFAREFEDVAQYADDPAWKQEQREELHWRWRRVIPSAHEIMIMETAIRWPAIYLAAVPQLLRTVQCAALVRSRGRSLHFAARRLKLPPRVCRRWNRDGLDRIAAGLRRDRVAVF